MGEHNELDLSVENQLTVKSEAGEVVLQVALVMHFFIANTHTQPVRDAITECIEAYLAMCGEHIRWTTNVKTHVWRPASDKKIIQPRVWFEKLMQQPYGEMKAWNFNYQGGKNYTEASHFTLSALGLGGWQTNDLGYLTLSLPITWFADNPGDPATLMNSFCQKLLPLSAIGGLGMVQSKAYESEYEPVVHQFAQQFPGLDVGNPVLLSRHMLNGNKGVNWLNVINSEYLEKLGGEAVIRSQLDDNFKVIAYPGGLFIQAGDKPQLGDAQRHSLPQHYVQLNKVLKSIRVAAGDWGFHHTGKDKMHGKEVKTWLARFD